jgi:hypothetical protein
MATGFAYKVRILPVPGANDTANLGATLTQRAVKTEDSTVFYPRLKQLASSYLKTGCYFAFLV